MRPRFYISEQAARKLLFVVITFEICLVAVFLASSILGKPSLIIHKLFNLDGEKNVPALFSSVQLFLIGIIFLSMAYQPRQQYFFSPLFLAILGVGFIFLHFDEALAIHEHITSSLKHIDWIPRFKGNHGIWVAPYLIIGLTFFILTYKNFLRMWNKYRRETTIMASGLVIFLVGVLCLEVIRYQFIRVGSSPSYLYKFEVALEEFLEMMGISIVLYGAILLRQVNPIKSGAISPTTDISK
jgi:hypothetical protein